MLRSCALPLFFALACGASATQVTLTATITPTVTLSDAQFVFVYDVSSEFGAGTLSLNYLTLAHGGTTLPGGIATPISDTFENDEDFPILGYTVLGLYDTGSVKGASIAYAPSVATGLLGNDWPYEDDLTESRYVNNYNAFFGPVDYDTLDIASHLIIQNGQLIPLGSDASLVNFSNGTAGGSVSNVQFTPVPEPGAFASVGLGFAAMARRRQR